MRIAILGNSGSGKSTLARTLSHGGAITTLDLDTIVWEPNRIAVAREPEAVLADLNRFCSEHPDWIVEGCYAGCIEAALAYQPELIWLDPGNEICQRNCRNRPFEPHKYASAAEQDARLAFLLDWVAAYYTRDDDMSEAAHRALFEKYTGQKQHITTQSA